MCRILHHPAGALAVLVAGVLVILNVGPALAHNGIVLVAGQTAGGYSLSVQTATLPIGPGLLDLAIQVADQNMSAPVSGALVTVDATPEKGGPTTSVEASADPVQAGFYEAVLSFEIPGTWLLSIGVIGDLGSGKVETAVKIPSVPSRPRVSAWLVARIAAVAGVAIWGGSIAFRLAQAKPSYIVPATTNGPENGRGTAWPISLSRRYRLTIVVSGTIVVALGVGAAIIGHGSQWATAPSPAAAPSETVAVQIHEMASVTLPSLAAGPVHVWLATSSIGPGTHWIEPANAGAFYVGVIAGRLTVGGTDVPAGGAVVISPGVASEIANAAPEATQILLAILGGDPSPVLGPRTNATMTASALFQSPPAGSIRVDARRLLLGQSPTPWKWNEGGPDVLFAERGMVALKLGQGVVQIHRASGSDETIAVGPGDRGVIGISEGDVVVLAPGSVDQIQAGGSGAATAWVLGLVPVPATPVAS